MAFLKITSVPPGEAPVWVRECWVGLVLPLADGYDQAIEAETHGVLSSPRTAFGQFLSSLLDRPKVETGYIVDSLRAIEILAESSPEAANWWRVHCPDSILSGEQFVFHESVGHIVNERAP